MNLLTHPAFHSQLQFHFITSTRVEHERGPGHYRSDVAHDEKPFYTRWRGSGSRSLRSRSPSASRQAVRWNLSLGRTEPPTHTSLVKCLRARWRRQNFCVPSGVRFRGVLLIGRDKASRKVLRPLHRHGVPRRAVQRHLNCRGEFRDAAHTDRPTTLLQLNIKPLATVQRPGSRRFWEL